jgi:uncharacterized membrane protein
MLPQTGAQETGRPLVSECQKGKDALAHGSNEQQVNLVHNGLGLVAGVLLVALLAAYVLFIVGAFISILRSHFPAGMKFVWAVFVVIAPFLGSLLWFLIGRGYAERQYRPS